MVYGSEPLIFTVGTGFDSWSYVGMFLKSKERRKERKKERKKKGKKERRKEERDGPPPHFHANVRNFPGRLFNQRWI